MLYTLREDHNVNSDIKIKGVYYNPDVVIRMVKYMKKLTLQSKMC